MGDGPIGARSGREFIARGECGVIGLLIFGFAFSWIALCGCLANRIGGYLPESRWRGWLRFCLFVVLVCSLVIDEIVGGWQFRNLCAQEARYVSVDPKSAKNRAVYLEEVRIESVQGTMVPVTRQRWRYRDTQSDEVIVAFTTLHARGGFFLRRFGTAEISGPVLFTGYCAPPDPWAVFDRLEITRIERKNFIGERKK